MKPKQAKDPKKVRAGRMGGLVSPTSFKNNKKLASIAGKKSALIRSQNRLSRVPLKFLEEL